MSPRLLRLPFAAAATTLVLLGAGCGSDELTPVDGGPIPSASATLSPAAPSTTSEPASPTQAITPTPAVTQSPEPVEPTATQPTKAPPYDGPPRTYEEAAGRFDRAAESRELSRFASPDGNLYCVLDSPYLPPSCELGRGAIPDSDVCPADGPSRSVGRIEFTEVGPEPVCNSDTIREPDAPTLVYGSIVTWPDTPVTCVLEQFGVTCVNPATEQGYFLARGRYQLF